MTAKTALEHIYALPRFNRGETMEPVAELLRALREPQRALRFIHIAGTNGKGSVSAMCDAILRESGMRVGLYTSPFINDFRERFQIDGRPVNQTDFAQAAAYVLRALRRLPCADQLSQFDVVTAIGLVLFARAGCEIVVLECGLGGRLDATNVIAPPDVAVMVNIGFDHTELLGDSIEAITAEKCGILKPGTGAFVCAPQDYPTAYRVAEEAAAANGIPTVIVPAEEIDIQQCSLGQLSFSYRGTPYQSQLAAAYQARNAATAIEAIRALSRSGLSVAEDAIVRGLRHAYIPARLELISMAPHILLDGAHNLDGLRALRTSIEAVAPYFARLHCLVGMLREKEPHKALSAFFSSPLIGERLACVTTVTPPTPRACPAEELAKILHGIDTPPAQIRTSGSMQEALAQCLADMQENDLLLCFGSLYSMGALRRLIQEHYQK